MNIEIAEPGRMTQSGSSLLKLIQNNDMPILDLLVRESIQNSLDARKKDSRYVNVNFKTGQFNKRNLNSELYGVTDVLNKKYINEKYDFISIMDKNTVGLTGKLHYQDVLDNNYGNLLKLIYEISKPQSNEGAGGSWGLGKTVYFRIGIGLVLYYSRIQKENGSYESRMAACLVEDENKLDSLIPSYNGKSKRGIAWWGERIGENKTQPITDETYIENMLNIFGIEPYRKDETGTVIIIPYINETQLLKNNEFICIEKDEMENEKSYWKNSIEEYLKVAIQRWYSPRLNNSQYPYGAFLRASVNSEGIKKSSMEASFLIIQSLYNRAIGNEFEEDDILKNIDVKYERIVLRNILKYGDAGYISFVKVDRKLLHMEPPDNLNSPFEYFNCSNSNGDNKNKPIITYVRKPGMIVSYETVGPWVDGILPSNDNEFIIGVFVLNSNNTLITEGDEYSLEEYIRKSEMADHTSWKDFSLKNSNPQIINRIQGHLRRKISKEFAESIENDDGKRSNILSREFAKLLLPPQGFGKNPSESLRRKKNRTFKDKQSSFLFNINDIRYMKTGININSTILVSNEVEQFKIITGIDADGGKITFDKWKESLELDFPFNIDKVLFNISLDDKSNKSSKKIFEISGINNNYGCEEFDISILKENNISYGFYFEANKNYKFEIEADIKIDIKNREFNPSLIWELEGRKS